MRSTAARSNPCQTAPPPRRPDLRCVVSNTLDAGTKAAHSTGMPKSPDYSALPAVEVVEIDNQTMAQAGFQLFDQDLVRLQSAPLKGRQVIIRLQDCVLVYHTTNMRLRSRPTLPDALVAYVTFGPNSSGTANGLPVRNDIMLVVPPSNGMNMVCDPGYESMAFFMQPADISRHLYVRDMDDHYALPTDTEVLYVGGNLAGNLFAWGKRLVDLAVQDPAVFNSSKEQREAAKADLVDTLLTTLTSTRKLEPERHERTRQLQSEIVRSAERYALSHADERLYVTDLCRAAGVSERTLEYAFRAVMGLSPTAYLTRIRLHRVHHALLQAQPGSTTVTEEALNWGFWHFGEFSRAYKDCFDELPSNTLRRVSQPT